MASRPETPSHAAHGAVPTPAGAHLEKGYGPGNSGVADFAQTPGNSNEESPLPRAAQPQETAIAGDHSSVHESARETGRNRSASTASTAVPVTVPSRSGTLKKKSSIARKSSLKRDGSTRSRADSTKAVHIQHDSIDQELYNSPFHTPIPTTGTPTEILANRFQAWRGLLKNLITYFREVQSSYEHQSKALLKVSNVINNTEAPTMFITDGGLNDATRILRDFHKHSLVEANKARDIESDVVAALSGLRSDLGQKIKEIKSLSGDFKNSVDKEKEGTRRAVAALQEALAAVDSAPAAAAGKNDPFIVRLQVDRQVEKQIDEENYLHRAYLNLESSGRELESIVVGEIQKAYNALAGILKRGADDAYGAVESLRSGPLALPRDMEWNNFVEHDPHFVNPRMPLRDAEKLEYPGKHHPAAAEVRAGNLERKSKYLKSYTPGWYVLSPTHLHEFKSADRIYSQPPVMSLYLPDQKLGSKSEPSSSSHKFMLKGRQTGSMHRGHAWVFRAESYDTMLAWFEDIKALTEKTGEERNAFVRKHARSVSGTSEKAMSVSSDGMEEDEADAVPYSAHTSVVGQAPEEPPQRPQPGGRFPSDLQVNRHLQAPLSPSSDTGSSDPDRELAAATAAAGTGAAAASGGVPFPGNSTHQEIERRDENPYELEGVAGGRRAGLTEEDPASKTIGPHKSNVLNVTDPGVQPEPEKTKNRETSGPHKSDMMNKADPRVDATLQQTSAPRTQPGYPQREAPPTTQAYATPMQQKAVSNAHAYDNIPNQQQALAPQQNSFLGGQPDYAARDAGPPTTQTYAMPVQQPASEAPNTMLDQQQAPAPQENSFLGAQPDYNRHKSTYGDWLAPAAGGAAAGVIGTEAYRRHPKQQQEQQGQEQRHEQQEGQRQQPQRYEQQSDAPTGLPKGEYFEDVENVNPIPVPPKSEARSRNNSAAASNAAGVPFPGGSSLASTERNQRSIDTTGVAEPDGSSRTGTEPNNPRTRKSSGIVFMGDSPSTSNDSQQKTRDVADLAFTDTSPSAKVQPSHSERGDSNRTTTTTTSSSSPPAHPPLSKLPLPVSVSSPSAHDAATPAATYIAADPSDYLRSRGVPQEAKIGGLEAEGAHPTGRLFPKVLRHDTNMSIAQLHVPGEFPPPTPAPSGESAYPWRQAQ